MIKLSVRAGEKTVGEEFAELREMRRALKNHGVKWEDQKPRHCGRPLHVGPGGGVCLKCGEVFP